MEGESEPRQPHAVGEPVHHPEVPGFTAGRPGPGLRGRVQAAAQRQAPHRPPHPGPAGKILSSTLDSFREQKHTPSVMFEPVSVLTMQR